MKVWVQFAAIALLVVLLNSCGSQSSAVNEQLVQKALALKLQETQQQLSQQIYPSPAIDTKVSVERALISKQTPLAILGLPTYRVEGTYDVTLTLPQGKIGRSNNPFKLYLQKQPEGKTWRLVYPQSDASFRLSQPIF